MGFQGIDFIEPISEFIKRFPYLGNAKIDIMEFSPNALFEGNSLAYTGKSKPTPSSDITGDSIRLYKQANFLFSIRRASTDNEFRMANADFLHNFEDWVEYENYVGNPPRFSTAPYPEERIWADNGMFWQNTEQAGITDYVVQVHVEYMVEYQKQKREDDLEWRLNT